MWMTSIDYLLLACISSGTLHKTGRFSLLFAAPIVMNFEFFFSCHLSCSQYRHRIKFTLPLQLECCTRGSSFVKLYLRRTKNSHRIRQDQRRKQDLSRWKGTWTMFIKGMSHAYSRIYKGCALSENIERLIPSLRSDIHRCTHI